jgi:asparagine synthase (glutamine-hydrolysing)
MCGICGIIARGHAELNAVADAQVATMHHRGPDSHGTFRAPFGAISQNRLSIIDLVHGDPPITNEDGTSAVVLNGEVYNYKELRRGLIERGHRFGSEGDTEVIVHLSEELAPVELARALDGMFAFAVWDGGHDRLIVGRDRVGKKPLYYAFDGDRLVFGSEIKSIFADTSVPRRLDPSAIPAYLTFGYVPTPRTFFDGVRSLPPGHVLVYEPGGEPVIERYWEPPLADVNAGPHLDISLEEAARRVRATLTDAVRRRLVADVPLGAFLSGGIDSSAIVGVMASLIDRPVETFTIGFDDRDGFDERPFARAVAERHHTAHHEYVVHPDAVDLIERLVYHHDQPFGDSSAVPTFLLSEVTRGEVTVALSGDGGDELFAGYERFGAGLLANRLHALPAPVRAGLRGLSRLVPAQALRGRGASVQRFARVAELGLPDAYRSWISYIQDPERAALTNGRADDWAIEDYRAIWRASAGADTLDRLLDLNLRTYLLDDLLVKADRMSMAHSLEVRSPFLDSELLALAARLKPRLKLSGVRLKRVLKAAVGDLMPAELLNRPKRGFGVPLDRWFREDLRTYMNATLGAADSRVKEHLDADAVDQILAEHDRRNRNHGHALWTLLTLEVFLRREDW